MKWGWIILSVLFTGCAEPVRIAEGERVRVANDSDSIRMMIFAEGNRQMLARRGRTRTEWEGIIRSESFEGQEPPGQREFLKSIESAPGFDLMSPSDATILQTVADCRCTMKEQYTSAMDKIQLYRGSVQGPSWVGLRRSSQAHPDVALAQHCQSPTPNPDRKARPRGLPL